MSTNDSLPEQRAQTTSLAPPRQGIHLLDILIEVARRKLQVLAVTAAMVCLAIVISLVLPKEYVANATLLPPQQSSSTSAGLAAQLGNAAGVAALAGGSLLKNPNDLYVGMMKSRTVEDAMVNHFGLMQEYKAHVLSDAREDLEKRTKIDDSGKDNLIHISIMDHDPQRAAELTNGYVDQFRKLSASLAITEASQRRLFFEQQLLDSKNHLADAEEALKQTQQQTGVIQLDAQAKALIESAAMLRAQISAKEVQIRSMETFATAQNVQLEQAHQELDALRAQVAKLGGSDENADAGMLVPKGKVPEAGLEYVRKLRDVKYYETIFNILARQFEAAKLDEAKQGTVIQVVDYAVPPDRRTSPKRGTMVAIFTVLGFFMGVGIALLQAMYTHMRQNEATRDKIDTLSGMLSFRKA